METMKTWRSKLKKTGASALAAFMLCGSFSAFAQEPESGENDITMNSTTGDAAPAVGNVKTVTGYQTNRAVGYAANIKWGDMVFVYDRGKYDPNTGTLVGSFQGGDDTDPRTDVEAGAKVIVENAGGDEIIKVTSAGYWYGFNGDNNEVYIENLSTEEINITATPSVYQEEGSKVGENVAFTLYIDDAEQKGWKKGSESEGEALSDANKQFPGYTLDNAKVGATNGAINRNFAAAQRNEYGEIAEIDKERQVDTDRIWLNITGRPTDKFMDQKTYDNSSPKAGDKLGTITLSFKTTGTSAQELTPTKAVEQTPSA